MSDQVFDASGDGIIDCVAYDANGDGYVDIVAFDQNQNGWIDGYAIDTNADGVLDTYLVDNNEDGYAEAVMVDVHADGVDAPEGFLPSPTITSGPDTRTGNPTVDGMAAEHNQGMTDPWLEPNPDRDGDGWKDYEDRRPNDSGRR